MRQPVQLVSPPMPMGVGWLVNCLLELNIRTTPFAGHWLRDAGGYQLTPEPLLQDLLWHLPVLHRRRRFDFAEPLEVYWEHLLDFARYPARQTILFVRDLRDAVYSQFRRLEYQGRYQATEADLLRFLSTPFQSDSLPHLFDLPPADTLAYFCLFWLHQVPASQLLVLRFEDCKRDPLGQLQRVLDFLAVTRPLPEIRQAIAYSEFQQGLGISKVMQDNTGLRLRSFRAGRAGEWQTALSARALSHFCGPAEKALQVLGYAPLPESVPRSVVATRAKAEIWQQAEPLLQEFHRLLSGAQSGQAEALLKQALQICAAETDMTLLLAGQYLALLWTRAILRIDQHHLPAAIQMTRFFSAMNTQFSNWPPLVQAAAHILNPDHALHFLWPTSPLYLSPDPDIAFAQAASQAQASGQPFFLWLMPGVQIQNTGILQLCAQLEVPNSCVDAVVPDFAARLASGDFNTHSLELHARWGAEFEPITLQALPPCLLLRSACLKTLPLDDPPDTWLPRIPAVKALGVLAAFRAQADPEILCSAQETGWQRAVCQDGLKDAKIKLDES